LNVDRWRTPKVGYALMAALYLLSFPYHPGLRSPNELCRLWQSRAIVDHGTLHINATLQRFGMVGDLSCTLVMQDGSLKPCVGPEAPRQGDAVARFYYPSKAPLLSFLGAPVYWVLSKVHAPVSELTQVFLSRLFLTVLPSLSMLVLVRRFLGAYVSALVADVATVTYGLGTMAFNYAESFMSHQVTAALLFAAFFVAWRVERGGWKDVAYVGAGALAGLVVLAEYTGALGVVCVASYVVASRWTKWGALGRAVGFVIIGALPFLGALMAYHHACFGGPLVSGYKFLNDAAYQGWHQGGFLGIRLPELNALVLSFFSPLRGLFALSPFLLIAFLGFKDARAVDRAYFVMLVALLVANTYFTSSFAYSSWGWTVGPRHLTPWVPFLVLPVALVLERQTRAPSPAGRSLALGLCVSSVLATGLVGFVNYVPDDVSTSLWGLALPLLRDGVYPVSWLAALVPNPASGALLMVLLLAVTAWVATKAVELKALPLLLAVAVGVHFGALRLFTRYDEHDTAAKTFLESVWVAPNGAKLPF
jgi:4-amino-4-deoxy-L-arabinose transferase-like glycosyltransferase